jgi:hypothetical protein
MVGPDIRYLIAPRWVDTTYLFLSGYFPQWIYHWVPNRQAEPGTTQGVTRFPCRPNLGLLTGLNPYMRNSYRSDSVSLSALTVDILPTRMFLCSPALSRLSTKGRSKGGY